MLGDEVAAVDRPQVAGHEVVDLLGGDARRGVRRGQVGPRLPPPARPPRPARGGPPRAGSSPTTSHRPAGSSTSRRRAGWRYCHRQKTRSWSSTARITAAPGCSSTSRWNGASPWSPGAPHPVGAQRHHPVVAVQVDGVLDRPGLLGVGQPGVAARCHGRAPPQSSSGSAAQPGLVDREAELLLPLDRGPDQPGEQRVRPGRARAQLGVRLGGDVVGVHVARQLDELDQAVVGRGPGEHQPGLLEPVAVAVVDLVAVPVALLDQRLAVRRPRDGALLERRRVEAEPHGAAEVARALDEGDLLGHGGDHRLRGVRVELGGAGPLEAEHGAGVLDDHALQTQAQPEGRDAVGAGVGEGAELALDAPDAEAARDADRVDVLQGPGRTGGGLAVVGGDPADVDLGLVGEAAGAQRLPHGEVGVREVDVLADQPDRHLLLGVVHPTEQVVPDGPVDVAERQVESAYEVGVEPLAVQDLGDVVDRRSVGTGDDGVLVDVAHQRDLALDGLGQLAVRAADHGVGLDADLAQRGDRVLGGLGLQLLGRPDVGHQGHVQEEDVAAADVVTDLARRLEERQRLDVADGAADLGDHHVDLRAAHREDAVLDLVGDVRDHLDGVTQVVAATLLGDHRGVDLPGGDVGDLTQVGVQEALVVADVEIGLRAVVGHEDLAVLERVHRPRIDVQIGVQLLHRDPQTTRLQQASEAGCREALAE